MPRGFAWLQECSKGRLLQLYIRRQTQGTAPLFLLNRQVWICLGRPCGFVELVLVVLVLCVGHWLL